MELTPEQNQESQTLINGDESMLDEAGKEEEPPEVISVTTGRRILTNLDVSVMMCSVQRQ